jgi:hypothetical protein
MMDLGFEVREPVPNNMKPFAQGVLTPKSVFS